MELIKHLVSLIIVLQCSSLMANDGEPVRDDSWRDGTRLREVIAGVNHDSIFKFEGLSNLDLVKIFYLQPFAKDVGRFFSLPQGKERYFSSHSNADFEKILQFRIREANSQEEAINSQLTAPRVLHYNLAKKEIIVFARFLDAIFLGSDGSFEQIKYRVRLFVTREVYHLSDLRDAESLEAAHLFLYKMNLILAEQ